MDTPNRFLAFVPNWPDPELDKCIHNHLAYDIQAVEAAIGELARRGRPLTDAQLAEINSQRAYNISAQAEAKKVEAERADVVSSQSYDAEWKKSIVTDETAPMLYSRNAVRIMSYFFSPLFGSVLLYMNLRWLNRDKGRLLVINVGLLATSFSVLLTEFIPIQPINLVRLFGLALNLGVSALFTSIIWRKYIGDDTKYQKRSIAIPMIIGVLLILAIFFLNIIAQTTENVGAG